MVLQTVHEDFTSICINVLDVFESSLSCKGTIFSGINCQQGPASWFDDARDGKNQRQLESSSSSPQAAPVTPTPSDDQNDYTMRDSPDDIFMDEGDEAENQVAEMMDISMSSLRRRPSHRRNDSSLSVASTVSQAMYFPSDDDIFRMTRAVGFEESSSVGASAFAVSNNTGEEEDIAASTSSSGRPSEMNIQRCIAFSQEESGYCENNVYPCYPGNSSINRARLHTHPFLPPTTTQIIGGSNSDDLPFLMLERTKSKTDDEAKTLSNHFVASSTS